jgi:hypothetical protein
MKIEVPDPDIQIGSAGQSGHQEYDADKRNIILRISSFVILELSLSTLP